MEQPQKGVTPERNTHTRSTFCTALFASSTWLQEDAAGAAGDNQPVCSCTGDFPASYPSHGAMTSRCGDNLETAFLFTIRDGVGKVVRLVVKQCYQRSVTVDTELHDGISESLHHLHNSSTLLVN